MKKLVPLATLAIVISASLAACSTEAPPENNQQVTPMTKEQQDVGVNIRVNPPEERSSQEVGVNIQVNGSQE